MSMIIDYENKLIYIGDGYEVVQYEEDDATFFDDEGNEYWYDEAEDITYVYDEETEDWYEVEEDEDAAAW